MIEDAKGNHLDSCWGYIEPDGAEGYVLETGRDSFKYHIEEAKKEIAKRKADEKAVAKEFGMEKML